MFYYLTSGLNAKSRQYSVTFVQIINYHSYGWCWLYYVYVPMYNDFNKKEKKKKVHHLLIFYTLIAKYR
jgi:hypothetical protein